MYVHDLIDFPFFFSKTKKKKKKKVRRWVDQSTDQVAERKKEEEKNKPRIKNHFRSISILCAFFLVGYIGRVLIAPYDSFLSGDALAPRSASAVCLARLLIFLAIAKARETAVDTAVTSVK